MNPLCHCGKARRAGNSWCLACHAAYMRRWRKTHTLSKEARRRSNARAYLHVYLRRGKIKRQPCQVCGRVQSQPHHKDYSKPLEVIWLCSDHHQQVTNEKDNP